VKYSDFERRSAVSINSGRQLWQI